MEEMWKACAELKGVYGRDVEACAELKGVYGRDVEGLC